MKNILLWFEFTRPKTLVVSIAPVMLAAAFVWQRNGFLSTLTLVLVTVLSMLVQIACNFTNDYYDHLRKTDNADRRKGVLRALQRGEISAAAVLRAMLVLNIFIVALALYFASNFGFIFFVVIVVCQLAGFSYTGGKFPLAYNGLGDVFAFVFFGPVVVLASTAILNNGQWLFAMPFLAASVVCGLFSLALITVNNLRDADSDVLTKKKTLAVLLGKTFASWEYRFCIFLLAIFPLSAAWSHERFNIALPVFALLLLLRRAATIHLLNATQLNNLLAKTGTVYFLYVALWCMVLLVY